MAVLNIYHMPGRCPGLANPLDFQPAFVHRHWAFSPFLQALLVSCPCFMFLLIDIVISSAPRRGNLFKAQGNALGMIRLWAIRPVRAVLISCCFFIIAPVGRCVVCSFYPGRCHGLANPLGLQPVVASNNQYNIYISKAGLGKNAPPFGGAFGTILIRYSLSIPKCLRNIATAPRVIVFYADSFLLITRDKSIRGGGPFCHDRQTNPSRAE